MAEQITYDNLNMELVVWYNGTVSAFENEVYTKDISGKPTSLNQISSKLKEYADKVILITGSTETNPDTAGKAQAIFISKTNANGTIEGKLMKLSDIPGYIAGINVGGTDHVANGNVILKLVGNGITISVNPEGTVNFDASTLKKDIETAQAAAEAVDDRVDGLSNTVNTLVGNDINLSARAIAKAEAEAVEENLLGPEGANASSVTIRGNRKAVDDIKTALFGMANPESMDKIQTSVLPDVIMGQLKFGGTIGNTATSTVNQKLKVSPTSSYIDEFRSEGITGPFEITTKFNSSVFDPSKNEGWYFIVKKPNAVGMGGFGWNATTGTSGTVYEDFYEVGDWFLSTGEAWEKIDNTDTVVGVAGMQGDITTESLVGKLSTKNDKNTDPLAKKSEILLKGVKVADASKEYITVNKDATTKEATISVDTASMQDVIGEFIQGNDALATANDVFNFIKARLSIKVVSSN